ncbi:MAG: glycosyltransferase family 2 protein [Methanosarcinaceae archaeon]|nr:glycosyltransferase family 2 protein [Methanosarcinaceae archaeon]
MKKLNIIIPVAPSEPISVMKKSLESLLNLKQDNLIVHITYAMDIINSNDSRINSFLDIIKKHSLNQKVSIIIRNYARGRRAGATNDAIDKIKTDGLPDFFAFFDVDSRPDSNFLIECTTLLKKNNVKIASGYRYITNSNESTTSLIVSLEYAILKNAQQFLERINGFKQFNGLIGVMDAKLFKDLKFDELAACEDVMMTQEVYLSGCSAAFSTKTRIGEQSPISLKEYYNQRLRWINGAYECLTQYLFRFIKSNISMNRKITWFFTVVSPFISIITIPLIVFCIFTVWNVKKSITFAILGILGLMTHAVILQVCSLHVIYKRLFNIQIEWTDTRRSNE